MQKDSKVIAHGVKSGRGVAGMFSGDYKVRVNGVECTVYAVRVSAMPFNRSWPGKQRPLDQTEAASSVSFEADGPVTLEVQCAREFKKAVVRPLSKKVTPEISCKAVTFELKKPGQYVLELDGEHFCLHIFFNPANGFEKRDKATHYFGAGVHFPGLIRLKDGDSVYIDKDAVVYGSLYGKEVKDIGIFGYGILDGSYEERLTEHCYEDYTKGNVKFYECENIRIEGVTFRNSAIWCVNLFACRNVEINNIKIVGQWRYNTDGIDIVNSRNVTVKNSFVRSFDDTVTLKGIDLYNTSDVKNIRVQNCVLWCGWGRNLEIGFETACAEYSDIVFEDCDLIRTTGVCLDIQNGDYALIRNIIFKDIRIECQSDGQPELMQHSDEQKYNADGKVGLLRFIVISNPRFREIYADLLAGMDTYFLPPAEYAKMRGADGKVATVRDILLDNVQFFLEEGAVMPHSFIGSATDGEISGITIKDLSVNGKKITHADEINLKIGDRVKNLSIR